MTAASKLNALWDGESINVRSEHVAFTITRRAFAGVRGFACIPAGRKRPAGGHRIMSKAELAEWLETLELDSNA